MTIRHRRSRIMLIFVGMLLALVLGPATALAQDDTGSHWGATVSFVPRFQPVSELYDLLWGGELDPTGHELRIGLVRGRDTGGDWSVSLVRNRLRMDQVFDDTFENQIGNQDLWSVDLSDPYPPATRPAHGRIG